MKIKSTYTGMPGQPIPIKRRTKLPGPTLMCGNYIERTDAVFVRMDGTTIYFSNNMIIAIIQDNIMYRDINETSGHAYRRINAALRRQPCKETKNVKKNELYAMVDIAIMHLASRMVDEKLGINTFIPAAQRDKCDRCGQQPTVAFGTNEWLCEDCVKDL